MIESSNNDKKGQAMAQSKLKELIVQREKREKRNISNGEIAEATGLDEHTIGRWMRQKPFSRIEVASAAALCAYLRCTLDELLDMVYPEAELN